MQRCVQRAGRDGGRRRRGRGLRTAPEHAREDEPGERGYAEVHTTVVVRPPACVKPLAAWPDGCNSPRLCMDRYREEQQPK